jgi:hypothetical protein
MADDTQDQAGLGNFFTGGGGRTDRNFQTMKARMEVDTKGMREINREFENLGKTLKSVKSDMDALVKSSANLKGNLSGISLGGGGSGRTSAGGIQTNPNYITSGQSYAQQAAAGSPPPEDSGGGLLDKFKNTINNLQQVGGVIAGRVQSGYGHALTADRTGLLYRQMYGGSELQYQSQYRQPLAGRLLGRNAIEPLLSLQASTGINANQIAGSVESMRVASGFGLTAGQGASMINALAQPGSSNMMTLMAGMGLYGAGGKVNDPMAVIQNLIQRLGLTNETSVAGAFQPGSMTRSNLSRMGLPDDMQNFVLQYAQQNVQFKKRGGSGFYDPSSEGDRGAMGVDDSFAMEEQRTRMEETLRSEKFYRRQVDNYAQLEKNTQGLIKVFAKLEDQLSGIIGAQTSLTNKWWIRGLGSIGGALGLGDSEHLAQPGMNSGFASSLRNMKNAADDAGVPLKLTSGVRSSVSQENLFRARHTESPDGDISWNGKTWSLNPGASPAAPPGSSLHETGHAADLGPPSSYNWIMANAARFGLRHGASFGEPWHVAPSGVRSTADVTSHRKPSAAVTFGARGRSTTNVAATSSSSVPTFSSTVGMSISESIESMSMGGYADIGDSERVGGGSSITIAPTINMQGSGNSAADAEKLAQKVINLIESSSAISALRRS